MFSSDTPETQVSTVLARNGPILIFQSHLEKAQALFVSRDEIPRFMQDPHTASMLVIPPFASIALRCFAPLDHVDAITLSQDLALGENFHLTLRERNRRGIRFYSRHEDLPGPRTLRAGGIRVAITPRLVATVETGAFEPKLRVIVDRLESESADYRNRFACETSVLRNAVLLALNTQPQENHDT
jgi:hypothetical protein